MIGLKRIHLDIHHDSKPSNASDIVAEKWECQHWHWKPNERLNPIESHSETSKPWSQNYNQSLWSLTQNAEYYNVQTASGDSRIKMTKQRFINILFEINSNAFFASKLNKCYFLLWANTLLKSNLCPTKNAYF